MTENNGAPTVENEAAGTPPSVGWSHNVLPTEKPAENIYSSIYEPAQEVSVDLDKTGSQEFLVVSSEKRTRWADLTSREKHMTVVIAIVSILMIGFMAGMIKVVRDSSANEPYLLPTTPHVATELPPWLTYATTTKLTTRTTTRSTTTTTPTTVTTTTPTTTTPTPPCSNLECALASGRMLSAMNFAVDKCEDFYSFSCGGWTQKNSIPESEGLWDVVAEANEALRKKIRGILEDDITAGDADAVKIARNLYSSCMLTDDADGKSRLQNLLANVDAKDDVSLSTSLSQLQASVGQSFLLNLLIDVDEATGESHRIYIDRPDFGLPRSYLLEGQSKYIDAYRNLIKESFKLILDLDDGAAENAAENVVKLESNLASMTLSPEDRQNKSALYNEMNIEDLGSQSINWPTYFQELFPDYDMMVVIVQDVEYFWGLDTVLDEFSAEDIQNYLSWRLISALPHDVASELSELFYGFDKVLEGVWSSKQTWKYCVDEVNTLMGPALAYKYVRKYFNEDYRDGVLQIIQDVQQALNETLADADWISDEVRANATLKIEQLKTQLAYPEWLNVHVDNSTQPDPSLPFNLVHYYQNLSLTEEQSHLQNVLDILEWKSSNSLEKLNATVDADAWTKDIVISGGFYSWRYNTLTVPAGLIQLPFYGLPVQYLNYAAIGFKIGHEIAHSLDDQGIQFDYQGRLTQWDESSLANFNEKAQCYIDQYNGYNAGNQMVNGNRTIGENIADNVGLNLALKAYRLYAERASQEQVLAGFDGYSSEQLFFVAYAQNFCGQYTPESLELQLKEKPHSPFAIRVNGTLTNSPDFHSIFQCQQSKPQCDLW